MKRLAYLLTAILALAAVSCQDDPLGSDEFTKKSPWSIIGTIGGSSWDNDIEMKSNGDWHAAFGVTVKSGDEFKFRKDKSWDVNLGASSVKVGKTITLTATTTQHIS